MQIFVGNLAFATPEEEIRRLFEPYGVVERVQIIQDRETSHSRGFGFVTIPDATTAQTAIAGLQGTSLRGRMSTIHEARPRL